MPWIRRMRLDRLGETSAIVPLTSRRIGIKGRLGAFARSFDDG
jgi:hypothetical protein